MTDVSGAVGRRGPARPALARAPFRPNRGRPAQELWAAQRSGAGERHRTVPGVYGAGQVWRAGLCLARPGLGQCRGSHSPGCGTLAGSPQATLWRMGRGWVGIFRPRWLATTEPSVQGRHVSGGLPCLDAQSPPRLFRKWMRFPRIACPLEKIRRYLDEARPRRYIKAPPTRAMAASDQVAGSGTGLDWQT